MDLNVVVLSGTLAAVPELRTLDTGTTMIRYLLTLRSEVPTHRVDVIPVVLWDPPPDVVAQNPAPGSTIHAAGAVQRRFWAGAGGQQSRVEIVAREVCLRDIPTIEPFVNTAGDTDDGGRE